VSAQEIIPAPTKLTIEDAVYYVNVARPGDFLLLARYNIAYAEDDIPDVSAQNAFIPLLLDGDGSQVIANGHITPFRENGYNYGIFSIYAQDVPVLLGTTFTVRVQGNPTIFTVDNIRVADAVPARSQVSEIATWIRNEATFLGDQWDIQMTDSVNPDQLTQTGYGYFQDAIPGLATIAPGLALISSENPDFGTPVPAPMGFAAESEARYDDVWWIGTTFETVSEETGLPADMIKSLVLLAFTVVFVAVAGYVVGGQGAIGALVVSFGVGLPIALSQGFAPWGIGMLVLAGVSVFTWLRLVKNWS